MLLWPLVPEDSFRRYRATWARTTDPYNEKPPPFLAWLASKGDTVVLAHLAAVAPRGSDDEAVARAHLALARRDTADAVRRFLALPDSSLLNWRNTRIVKVQLLRETGHLEEAERLLRRPLSPWGSNYEFVDGLWHLERGRTFERLGESGAARRAYRTVTELWIHADPDLQPLVAEAREALARLGTREPA